MKALLPETIHEIESFFAGYPLRRYKKGQILVLPDEAVEHAYLLVEGRLCLYDVSYRGDKIIIDMFKNPAFFPLPVIINQTSSFLVHEADTDIVVRQAPIMAAKEFLDTHPEVVHNLLSLLYKKFDDALRRMVRLMDSNAKARLIYELIVTCRQLGDIQDDGSWILSINQAALGGRVGLARETVSREMHSLKQKGLVAVRRSSIHVPDMAQLEAHLERYK